MSLHNEIAAAVDRFAAELAAHPERRQDLTEQAILRNVPRPWPVFYLGHAPDITFGESPKQKPEPIPADPEERLLRKVRGMAGSLAMHNPIGPRIGLGLGTGTLPASFGIELDPALGYTPRGCRELDDVLADGMPDPETSGLIPQMREDIEAAQALTPAWMQIGLPDMQGPFNIAHMILGDGAFYAPYEEPEKFADLMTLITDFFIAVHQRLCRWIEPHRLPAFPIVTKRIAECSVNMLSRDMYLAHVLPHDQRLAEYYGSVAIHPCSGPHVFHATLEHLPNVCYHEVGFIEKAFAGSITVADGMAAIGDRPIIVSIGEEVQPGREEETIRRYFDLARTNHRLLFGFTGMHWNSADEPMIRDLHLRLDDYWHEHVWGAQ